MPWPFPTLILFFHLRPLLLLVVLVFFSPFTRAEAASTTTRLQQIQMADEEPFYEGDGGGQSVAVEGWRLQRRQKRGGSESKMKHMFSSKARRNRARQQDQERQQDQQRQQADQEHQRQQDQQRQGEGEGRGEGAAHREATVTGTVSGSGRALADPHGLGRSARLTASSSSRRSGDVCDFLNLFFSVFLFSWLIIFFEIYKIIKKKLIIKR